MLNDCVLSFVAVSCVKLLFVPLYKSTDFEVHRNWMAITFQKPISEWYTENTSQWTLDYPPLFAWFEFLLSKLAVFFDPKMLNVTNLNYQSSQTLFFMRLSVIFSDILYCYAVNRLFNLIKKRKRRTGDSIDPWFTPEFVLAMLLLWNPGLLLVDHIHFQYNGFLNGFLLLSIADMLEEKFIFSAFWFSILLNFKHIYLYLAPAYFFFLLQHYCFQKNGNSAVSQFCFKSFFKLASTGLLVMTLSFGPFVYMGQFGQVISRLFPVKRGLTHSYWAPNVWALYNFADWFLTRAATYFKLTNAPIESCFTRGIVGECDPAVLPRVSPFITLILTTAAIAPVLFVQRKRTADHFRVFLDGLIFCAFASFLFGYHVHEKAVLLILIPLTLSSVLYSETSGVFVFLSIVGHFSLFPLLHKEGETLLKILLLCLHIIYALSSMSQLHRSQRQKSILTTMEVTYLAGLIALQFLYSFSGLYPMFQFLPLMLISTYCAAGVVYAWLKYCYISIDFSSLSEFQQIKKRV